jgi:hypothetical protein
MPATKTINVHRAGQHVYEIPCDPDQPGWVIVEGIELSIKSGDRLDMAITYDTGHLAHRRERVGEDF